MFRIPAFRRLAALFAAVVASAGVLVSAAAPASAFSTPVILTAQPGPAAGTIFLTFENGTAPYVVEVYAEKPRKYKDKVLPLMSVEGIPGGTLVTGLAPSTPYWVFVVDGFLDYSDGVEVMSGALVPGTNLWMQSYGRQQETDRCDAGWWTSYAQWPHGGRGGWTCDRYVAMYG